VKLATNKSKQKNGRKQRKRVMNMPYEEQQKQTKRCKILLTDINSAQLDKIFEEIKKSRIHFDEIEIVFNLR